MTKLTAPLMNHNNVMQLRTHSYTTLVNLQQLIDERKVIRVMQPALLEKVTTAVRRRGMHPHVMQFNGQVYLDLHTIKSDSQRELAFRLLRKLQIGEDVDITQFPAWLQHIIEPGKAARAYLIGSATAGIFIGIAGGVLAMAIGLLIMSISGAALVNESGIQNTAVVFVIATLIGWLVATAVLWWQRTAAANSQR